MNRLQTQIRKQRFVNEPVRSALSNRADFREIPKRLAFGGKTTAKHDFEQRGFSSSIGTNNGDSLSTQAQIERRKQRTALELHCCSLQNHDIVRARIGQG